VAEAHSGALEAAIQHHVTHGTPQCAYELLVRSYGQAVFAYCVQFFSGDRSRAEDLTQEVFLEAGKKLDQFQGRSSAKTWLLTIAHNRCVTQALTAQRRRTLLRERARDVVQQTLAAPLPELEARALEEERHAQLQAALRDLSPEERSLVLLRFGVGTAAQLSTEELATLLGVSRASAYRKLEAVLHKLKDRMGQG
jgi:RNA polymerase sigma-70 factor (ECF subfamily)